MTILPAWCLMPVRVVGRYSSGKYLGEGFRTREEANWFIHNEGDHLSEYRILDDNQEG